MASDPDPRRFLLDILPKNSIGAEIGVHKGDFSRKILRTVSPEALHLIDRWRHETSETYKDAWYGAVKLKADRARGTHATSASALDSIARSARDR